MKELSAPLSCDEQIILNLRAIYSQYGYMSCRVGNFEEYDFYARNRSALSGEEVLVFTDADGRLMALKPDVTMSIVKNMQEGIPGLRKLYYNESVYRIPTGGTGFRESVQTGLECIGSLDTYTVCEVLMLALRSLETISSSCILNLSHLEIIDGLLEQATDSPDARSGILKAMEQKNLTALGQICGDYRIADSYVQALKKLTGLFGTLKETLPIVESVAVGRKMKSACYELGKISESMAAYGWEDKLHLDFSIRAGTDYYSGLVFQGLVSGLANPVLRGGRYDGLIRRMGKPQAGIGFAVYLDQLEGKPWAPLREKVLVLYGESTPARQVSQAVEKLTAQGKLVRAEREVPPECKEYTVIRLTEGGLS